MCFLQATGLPTRALRATCARDWLGLGCESWRRPGFTGTAWGAYNALTEYTQHGRDTRSPASMLYNMLDGGFATVRNNFASALLA